MKLNVEDFNLTMEQQFKIQILQKDMQRMNLEQAKEMLTESLKTIMVKENIIKSLMKEALK